MSKKTVLRSYLLITLTIILSTACCSPSLTSQETVPIPASPQKQEFSEGTAALPTEPIPVAETPSQSPTAYSPTEETIGPITSPAVEVSTSSIPNFGPTLAFLKDGDIWMLDQPGSEPYPLTFAGDILGFTWSPNGERLAAFNGKNICFYYRDGSIRSACLDLGLNVEQSVIPRHLIMSPDQHWIVLWNPSTPQEKGTIGWMIVALDTTNIMYRIEDPVEWGATLTPENEPGGFTGMPLFLEDGHLVGTISHQSLCSEYDCKYDLNLFNFQTHEFELYSSSSDGKFSQGISLTLDNQNSNITNFRTQYSSCEDFATMVDVLDLNSSNHSVWSFEGEALTDVAFNPSMDQAIIALTTGCSETEDVSWSETCGLTDNSEILSMQFWNPDTNQRNEFMPGISPKWSPDGNWFAFRSCLSESSSGKWNQNSDVEPEIFIFNPQKETMIMVMDGLTPQWQPHQ